MEEITALISSVIGCVIQDRQLFDEYDKNEDADIMQTIYETPILREKSELHRYLSELSVDEIMMLQTIMYIGSGGKLSLEDDQYNHYNELHEYDKAERDDLPDIRLPIRNHEKYIRWKYERLIKSKDEINKSHEVEHIFGKRNQLVRFMNDARGYLGI